MESDEGLRRVSDPGDIVRYVSHPVGPMDCDEKFEFYCVTEL